MTKQTTSLSLSKPEITDKIVDTITQLASNFDVIDSSLAESMKYSNQEDFVQTLKRHMKYKGTFAISPSDVVNGLMSIVYDIGNSKAVSYTTYKNANDDYVVVSGGKYGTLTNSLANAGDKNYDSDTGTWNKASMPSYYATVVGATFTFSFYGSGLDFNFFGDTRGGLWKFIVDGDTSNPVNISTWRSVATSPATAQVFRQLENKQHTVVATFMGDDPANVPSTGAGTARGWANYATDAPTHKPTFTQYAQSVTNTEIVKLFGEGSNKDFAVSMRKTGTTNPYYFIPQHQAGTGFKVSNIQYLVDGVPTTLQNGISLTGVREFKIIQQIYGKVPETTENLAKFTTIWSFYGDGTVNIDGKMEVLTPIDVDWGYGIMFTLDNTFTTKLKSSLQKTYATLLRDDSNEYLTEEKDLATSYVSLNDGAYKNLAIAVTYNNQKQTLRQGKTNKPVINQNTFIQHRNSNITKLYQVAYYNTTLPVGEVFRWSGTFFIACFDNLYDLIS